jgi:hypothetical protein
MNTMRMALLALLLQNPAAQPPPKPPVGTAAVEGIVLKLGSTDPLAGVDLELTTTSASG